jgi:dihydrofolate synthase / folylpolyglutamate synthase
MVDTLVITEPDFHKKMAADELAAVAKSVRDELGVDCSIVVEPDWRRALNLLREASAQATENEQPLNVVTGTLYLIADVRSWLLHGTNSEKGW